MRDSHVRASWSKLVAKVRCMRVDQVYTHWVKQSVDFPGGPNLSENSTARSKNDRRLAPPCILEFGIDPLSGIWNLQPIPSLSVFICVIRWSNWSETVPRREDFWALVLTGSRDFSKTRENSDLNREEGRFSRWASFSLSDLQSQE